MIIIQLPNMPLWEITTNVTEWISTGDYSCRKKPDHNLKPSLISVLSLSLVDYWSTTDDLTPSSLLILPSSEFETPTWTRIRFLLRSRLCKQGSRLKPLQLFSLFPAKFRCTRQWRKLKPGVSLKEFDERFSSISRGSNSVWCIMVRPCPDKSSFLLLPNISIFDSTIKRLPGTKKINI